jgi:tripartite-type tricarboxylate transporter receptor subunit TctC
MKRMIAVALLGFANLAAAQPWPVKPVRIIVAFPAGGPTEDVGRVLAERFAKIHGRQFLVENRRGAVGNIGAESWRLRRSATPAVG